MSLFIWDDSNLIHLAKHSVSPIEAEEASLGFVRELCSYVVDEELRFEEVGQTRSGRILKMVIVVVGDQIRFVTAFDAPANLKRYYLSEQVNS